MPEATLQFSRPRWLALCARLLPQLEDPELELDFLRVAYAEHHRAYHTAEHVLECLALLDECKDQAQRPDEIEFALWYHDAIYRTRNKKSEQRSAGWACLVMEGAAVSEDVATRVRGLIMATVHDAAPGAAPSAAPDAASSTADERLLVDIDLSILGRPPERFDRYERDVRREYRWVPAPLYRSKRREMLEAFLARPRIFATQLIADRFEPQARENLARSIAALS